MTVQTLNLDARQRAMLDEMGVKVWWPMAERAAPAEAPLQAEATEAPAAAAVARDVEVPVPASVAAAPRAAAPAPAPAPAVRPVAAAPAFVAAGAAAVLVDAPVRLYGEAGALAAGGWLVVADMLPEADGRHGEPFAGEAGRLLDNMLRALRLHEGTTPVHLLRTSRGIASGQPGSPRPMAEAFALHAAALAPRIVLALGPLAAQSLLQSAEPLGKLRGRAAPLATLDGVPLVASYHPAYLLRNPADKARAWADLCLAAEHAAR